MRPVSVSYTTMIQSRGHICYVYTSACALDFKAGVTIYLYSSGNYDITITILLYSLFHWQCVHLVCLIYRFVWLMSIPSFRKHKYMPAIMYRYYKCQRSLFQYHSFTFFNVTLYWHEINRLHDLWMSRSWQERPL